MPKTANVRLGEREYPISEKVAGVSIQWRAHLRQSRVMQVFESLDGALDQIVEAVNGMGDHAEEGQVRFAAGMTLATLAPALVQGLAYSIDEVIELLFDYAPELAKEREWILDNAYNEELIAAFIEVLKLNFPIFALWEMVRGSRAQATSTNSPITNGAGGTKQRAVRSKRR